MKQKKFVPTPVQIEKVIQAATSEQKDYLIALQQTLARMKEINQLLWEDVNFEERYLVLHTCKKMGGVKTPRKIYISDSILEVIKKDVTKKEILKFPGSSSINTGAENKTKL